MARTSRAPPVPRIWYSCEMPRRSASLTMSVFARGRSIPVSMIVVETRISVSPSSPWIPWRAALLLRHFSVHHAQRLRARSGGAGWRHGVRLPHGCAGRRPARRAQVHAGRVGSAHSGSPPPHTSVRAGARGRRFDGRDIPDARKRHMEGARDRRRRQGEHVHAFGCFLSAPYATRRSAAPRPPRAARGRGI